MLLETPLQLWIIWIRVSSLTPDKISFPFSDVLWQLSVRRIGFLPGLAMLSDQKPPIGRGCVVCHPDIAIVSINSVCNLYPNTISGARTFTWVHACHFWPLGAHNLQCTGTHGHCRTVTRPNITSMQSIRAWFLKRLSISGAIDSCLTIRDYGQCSF